MLIRRFGLLSVALMSAQPAFAQQLQSHAGHVDPLLALSVLASPHSQAIACVHSDVASSADIASAAHGGCASEPGGEAAAQPEAGAYTPGAYASAAVAQAHILALLAPAMFGFAWFGLMEAVTSNDEHRAVSPS